VRSNRAFLVRAVQWLASEAGIRQFLDIGSGIPNGDNVHAAAQRTAPESRIVCVDNDPIVLAHAHELVHSTPEGTVDHLRGDLRDSDGVGAEPRAGIGQAHGAAGAEEQGHAPGWSRAG
jgi:hypothetical protein